MEAPEPFGSPGAGIKGDCELSEMGIRLSCLLVEQQVLLTAESAPSLFLFPLWHATDFEFYEEPDVDLS